jgi:hypothetical protein
MLRSLTLSRPAVVRSLFISVALAAGFFCFSVQAQAAVYYFNNAVNTDPAELGNYWTDVAQTIPATTLPDTSVDEVTITPGAEYDGDAVFRGSAVNHGTVDNNADFYDNSSNGFDGVIAQAATFHGDASENNGTVFDSPKIRYYSSDTVTVRDFNNDPDWKVVADATTVDISGADYSGGTVF